METYRQRHEGGFGKGMVVDKVSVLLASSHTGLCQSLQQVLEHEDWIKVVGTSSSKSDTLKLTETLDPQVIILDFDMAGEELETSRQILSIRPEVKIIILSVYDFVGQVTVKRATKDAAPVESVNWLSKQSNPSELLRSISTARKKRRIH